MLFKNKYALLVTHSQNRQGHKNHFDAIMVPITLSLSRSLSFFAVPGKGSQWCPVYGHYHPPGVLRPLQDGRCRVFNAIQGLFSVLQALLFLSQYSAAVSQSLTDVLLALIQCIPVRQEKREPVHTPVSLRALTFEARLRQSSSQYTYLNKKHSCCICKHVSRQHENKWQ